MGNRDKPEEEPPWVRCCLRCNDERTQQPKQLLLLAFLGLASAAESGFMTEKGAQDALDALNKGPDQSELIGSLQHTKGTRKFPWFQGSAVCGDDLQSDWGTARSFLVHPF